MLFIHAKGKGVVQDGSSFFIFEWFWPFSSHDDTWAPWLFCVTLKLAVDKIHMVQMWNVLHAYIFGPLAQSWLCCFETLWKLNCDYSLVRMDLWETGLWRKGLTWILILPSLSFAGPMLPLIQTKLFQNQFFCQEQCDFKKNGTNKQNCKPKYVFSL